MPINYLDFEKPIADLEDRMKNIDNLKNLEDKKKLESEIKTAYENIYSDLTPWQKVQIARHPERPHTIDYINNLFSDFIPLAGDKKFSDDQAIIGGLARFKEKSVVVLGTEKGNSVETRIKHNFGMAKPEGYRKAQRLYKLADKFHLPIITFVDTAGAYPGREAEERGQAEAIAQSMVTSFRILSPIVSVIIGEGGSGGAIALATADKVLMLENSIYSVISPEGCASILWRDLNHVRDAAESLKLTAYDCKKLGVADAIIPELVGGAHRNFLETINSVGNSISNNLNQLLKMTSKDLNAQRSKKFLNITSDVY